MTYEALESKDMKNTINNEKKPTAAPFFTVAQLNALQMEKETDIPEIYRSGKHLIYSSPATLAFNSPGAEGFGVKRAGLSVPGSVMLIVAPGCCGRNTSCISEMPGYENRFFYLTMDETDLITGRHLKKIPRAVERLCHDLESAGQKPSVVMICITCVDALLGTDMERVCRKAEALVQLPVKPCYMYALTREGRRPPMVHVRQSIYSLLWEEKEHNRDKAPHRKAENSRGEGKKDRHAVNLLGFFAPLYEDCELYDLLGQAGITKIREISRCASYEEYLRMGEVNFNIILHPEVRPAAWDLDRHLQMPSIELQRLYQIDQIRKQYAALGKVLGVAFQDEEFFRQAKEAMQTFRNEFPDCVFAVGEGMNGNAFELALALIRYGFRVKEIFATPGVETRIYLQYLAELSPETKVYPNLDPGMYHYQRKENAAGWKKAYIEGAADRADTTASVTITIGRDAGYYHPECPNLPWISDRQPYGYMGVKALFEALRQVLQETEKIREKAEETRGKAAEKTEETGERAPETEKREIFQEVRRQSKSAARYDSTIRLGSDQAAQGSLSCGGGEQGKEEGNACAAMQKAVKSDEIKLSLQGDKCIGEEGLPKVKCTGEEKLPKVKGYRRFLTPFAPDQSGAVAVLFDQGGISVICDAGGCAGNICGFDEPRWFQGKSAIFSAGLRDMDAILGRDRQLVDKLAAAAECIDAPFAAIIGTPVPSVIGTDYHALRRMAEKKTKLPVLALDTNGMELYDVGAEKAYLELFRTFAGEKGAIAEETTEGEGEKYKIPMSEKRKQISCRKKGRLGVLGLTPLDFSDIPEAFSERNVGTLGRLTRKLQKEGYEEIICYGCGAGLDDVRRAGTAEKNLVVATDGLEAAIYLEKKFGTPYEIAYPPAEEMLQELLEQAAKDTCTGEDLPQIKLNEDGQLLLQGANILIIHQQVLANSLRDACLAKGAGKVQVASFFMMKKQLRQDGDVHLREESDVEKLTHENAYDIIIADPVIRKLLPDFAGIFLEAAHFAVSGRR